MEKSDEVVYQYIRSVFSTILLKDVVGRHNIRDIAKNKLAKDKNYNLIRIWEDEIKESSLLKGINSHE